jgi:hypothetical protein
VQSGVTTLILDLGVGPVSDQKLHGVRVSPGDRLPQSASQCLWVVTSVLPHEE